MPRELARNRSGWLHLRIPKNPGSISLIGFYFLIEPTPQNLTGEVRVGSCMSLRSDPGQNNYGRKNCVSHALIRLTGGVDPFKSRINGSARGSPLRIFPTSQVALVCTFLTAWEPGGGPLRGAAMRFPQSERSKVVACPSSAYPGGG